MHRIFIISIIFAFFAGCESMSPKPVIAGNTVSGATIGEDGFSFVAPVGFEIYDDANTTSDDGVKLIKALAESYVRSGASPYYVVMSNNNVYLAFIPQFNNFMQGRTRRAYLAGAENSTLTESEKLAKLLTLAENITYNEESFSNVETSSAIYNGIPMGLWRGTASTSNGFDIPVFSVFRLGESHDSYSVIGVTAPNAVAESSGVFSAKYLLSKLSFNHGTSASGTTAP